jgi:Lon protease-like protein
MSYRAARIVGRSHNAEYLALRKSDFLWIRPERGTQRKTVPELSTLGCVAHVLQVQGLGCDHRVEQLVFGLISLRLVTQPPSTQSQPLVSFQQSWLS